MQQKQAVIQIIQEIATSKQGLKDVISQAHAKYHGELEDQGTYEVKRHKKEKYQALTASEATLQSATATEKQYLDEIERIINADKKSSSKSNRIFTEAKNSFMTNYTAHATKIFNFLLMGLSPLMQQELTSLKNADPKNVMQQFSAITAAIQNYQILLKELETFKKMVTEDKIDDETLLKNKNFVDIYALNIKEQMVKLSEFLKNNFETYFKDMDSTLTNKLKNLQLSELNLVKIKTEEAGIQQAMNQYNALIKSAKAIFANTNSNLVNYYEARQKTFQDQIKLLDDSKTLLNVFNEFIGDIKKIFENVKIFDSQFKDITRHLQESSFTYEGQVYNAYDFINVMLHDLNFEGRETLTKELETIDNLLKDHKMTTSQALDATLRILSNENFSELLRRLLNYSNKFQFLQKQDAYKDVVKIAKGKGPDAKDLVTNVLSPISQISGRYHLFLERMIEKSATAFKEQSDKIASYITKYKGITSKGYDINSQAKTIEKEFERINILFRNALASKLSGLSTYYLTQLSQTLNGYYEFVEETKKDPDTYKKLNKVDISDTLKEYESIIQTSLERLIALDKHKEEAKKSKQELSADQVTEIKGELSKLEKLIQTSSNEYKKMVETIMNEKSKPNAETIKVVNEKFNNTVALLSSYQSIFEDLRKDISLPSEEKPKIVEEEFKDFVLVPKDIVFSDITPTSSEFPFQKTYDDLKNTRDKFKAYNNRQKPTSAPNLLEKFGEVFHKKPSQKQPSEVLPEENKEEEEEISLRRQVGGKK